MIETNRLLLYISLKFNLYYWQYFWDGTFILLIFYLLLFLPILRQYSFDNPKYFKYHKFVSVVPRPSLEKWYVLMKWQRCVLMNISPDSSSNISIEYSWDISISIFMGHIGSILSSMSFSCSWYWIATNSPEKMQLDHLLSQC